MTPPVKRTADPAVNADCLAGPDRKWGLGLVLNTTDQPGRRAAGSGAWAGGFNTHVGVDPISRLSGAIYTQFLPFVTPEALGVYSHFEQASYAARRS